MKGRWEGGRRERKNRDVLRLGLTCLSFRPAFSKGWEGGRLPSGRGEGEGRDRDNNSRGAERERKKKEKRERKGEGGFV